MQEVNARTLLSDAKFFDSYSRWDDTLGRYETWNESVERVMNMHRKYYKDTAGIGVYIDEAEKAYKEKRVLGAQRALQFGGDQLIKHPARLYNCSSAHADRADFFGEYFYLLLCGCGVGFSVQHQHIAKLPDVLARKKQPKTHVVEDSIEGWATAMDVLLSSYFQGGGKHPEYEGRKIYFDLNNIRKKGAPISGGFKAPGPEPLRMCLDRVEHLIQGKVLKGETRLKPIEVYDICMHIADAVLSGGVRRAATICLFSVDDKEMTMAKTGNWYYDNPQRARSNNSAVIKRDEISREQFSEIMKNIRQFGEPGFFFVDDYQYTSNPCVTKDTLIRTTNGFQKVEDLIETPFMAMVDDVVAQSHTGFVKTGTKAIYELKTVAGYSLKATSNHKIKTRRGWVELGDLQNDDDVELSLMDDTPLVDHTSEEFKLGWIVGSIVGDGGHNPEKYSSYVRFWRADEDQFKYAKSVLETLWGKKINRKINEQNNCWSIESVNLSTICGEYITPESKLFTDISKIPMNTLSGIISGYIDSDGTVAFNPKKGSSVRITSISTERLKQVQLMLNSFGIKSSIYKNRNPEGNRLMPKNDGTGDSQDYWCAATHELIIRRESIGKLSNIISLKSGKKREAVENIINHARKNRGFYADSKFSKVESIEPCGFEDVYDCRVEGIHCFNANGVIVHNCLEIGMYPVLDGKSGFQKCNLSEINGGMCDTEEAFYNACRSAAILGTLQAGYTNFKFLTETTRKIVEREALLGVSITGWMNSPDILFNSEVLKRGAKIVRETNKEVAEVLGINQAARTTCVKPSGSASVILGTASGIHAEHSKKYIRSVQFNKMSSIAHAIQQKNPHMVEDSVWSAGGTDVVISFPVIAENSYYKDDYLGVKHLELIKLAQENWVIEGTNEELCVKPGLRHNVSNTILVDDWDAAEEYVYNNRNIFTGVAFLSLTGDKDYYQAPNIEVLDEVEIITKYGAGAIFASGLIVDGLKTFDNFWDACAKAIMDNDDVTYTPLQIDWIRRFNQFSQNYFGGDLKKTEYCLKDVYILHKWWKIQTHYKEFDLINELNERPESVDIDTMAGAACVGVSENGELGCVI